VLSPPLQSQSTAQRSLSSTHTIPKSPPSVLPTSTTEKRHQPNPNLHLLFGSTPKHQSDQILVILLNTTSLHDTHTYVVLLPLSHISRIFVYLFQNIGRHNNSTERFHLDKQPTGLPALITAVRGGEKGNLRNAPLAQKTKLNPNSKSQETTRAILRETLRFLLCIASQLSQVELLSLISPDDFQLHAITFHEPPKFWHRVWGGIRSRPI
jgi:hypothetical protein